MVLSFFPVNRKWMHLCNLVRLARAFRLVDVISNLPSLHLLSKCLLASRCLGSLEPLFWNFSKTGGCFNRGKLDLAGRAYYDQEEIRQNICNSKINLAKAQGNPMAFQSKAKISKNLPAKKAEVYAFLGLHPFGLIPSCWRSFPCNPVHGLRAQSHGGRECSR